jgi:hypothetical protein
MIDEKRKEKRYKEENKVVIEFSVEGLEQNAKAIFAFTQDISIGGAKILTDKRIPVGTDIKLSIDLDRSKQSIVTWANVRWSKSLYNGTLHEIGVKFRHDFPNSIISLIKHFYGKGIPPALDEKNKDIKVDLTYT